MNKIATVSEPSLLNTIASMALDPAVDVEKIKALVRLQREVAADQARIAFARAMSAAQAEMISVVRDAENKHTRSRYATLEVIDKAVRPIYSKHGFSLSFNGGAQHEKAVEVVCECSHRDGHSKTYALTGGLDTSGAGGNANKTAIQGLGSSATYLRRYLTMMIFNISLADKDDDDGNAGRARLTRINEEQKAKITGLLRSIADAGIDASSFYAWIRDNMDAETIDDIKAADFPRVVTALTRKFEGAPK